MVVEAWISTEVVSEAMTVQEWRCAIGGWGGVEVDAAGEVDAVGGWGVGPGEVVGSQRSTRR
jgi:hypothetical protein